MPLVTIHFHTKEGEKLNLGKSSEKLAEDFEKSKIDYLILTDKATACEKIDLPIKAYKKIKSYLDSKKDNLIFGLEFLTYDNFHVLGLCLNEEKWENRIAPKSLEDVCRAIEKDNGIIAVPHQFGICGLGERVNRIYKLYEIGEVSCKPLIEVSYYLECVPSLRRELTKSNKKAIEYARENDLAMFSGLDSRFKSFDLAFNSCKEEPEIALRKASNNGFKNDYVIPYITLSHFPMFRETLYLVRDHGIGFVRTGKFGFFDFLMDYF
ncbi:MAG: hypothetical protein ACP5PX_07635 [Candidatus Hadarchaeum sp.]|uniref:hypothetical protein n=1 Tax=Candidatus Hadarchaeum sp. TaxID=2883567 RepID=UPI003D0C7219